MLTHGINWPYFHADWDPFDLYQYPWGPTNDPPGYLCTKIRAIPSFDARYRAELLRVARDAWDVPALTARLDRASTTLHSRPLGGASATDLATFDAHLGEVKSFVSDRRSFLANLLGF